MNSTWRALLCDGLWELLCTLVDGLMTETAQPAMQLDGSANREDSETTSILQTIRRLKKPTTFGFVTSRIAICR